MKYRIDAMSLRDGTLVIEGWAIGSSEPKVKISMTDRKGRPFPCTAVERDRVDVMQQFGADRMCGFTAAAPFERGQEVYLVLRDGSETRRLRVNEETVRKKNSIRTKRSEKLLALCHFETVRVAWDFYRENGLAALWKKSVHKIRKIDEDYDYPEWELKTRLPETEYARQREAWKTFRKQPLISVVIPAWNTGENYLRMLFDSLEAQTYPNLEVVVADGSEHCESVRKVTEEYAAKADAAAAASAAAASPALSGSASSPEPASPSASSSPAFRVRYRYLDLGGNRGIAGNTNAGLAAASGEYIALCDHDDELPQNAMFAVAEAIERHPEAVFFYTDEDKIDFDGRAVFEPHFKPDYDPDLLTSVNYICHLSVIRRDLLERTGGFRAEFDGAQDHDFFLRCLEEAVREEEERLKNFRRVRKELLETAGGAPASGTAGSALPQAVSLSEEGDLLPEEGNCRLLAERTGFSEEEVRELLEGRFTSGQVIHIPEICYHWRFHKGSTAENPQSKLYAFEAGARAVGEHYRRLGIPFAKVEKGVTFGYYHTVFREEEKPCPADEIRLSVIIPNKDHTGDLDLCLRSIVERSSHRNIEFIIVENNSAETKTFDYYRNIDGNPAYLAPAAGCGKAMDRISVRVVRWEREFNYSAINNFGAQFAKGEMLLLLNNDVELIAPEALTEMISLAVRPETGAVGAKLLYGDDTVQHAGVIVGLGGIAGAAFVGLHEKENSYMHRMACAQDYSAVTAACLMLRKEVFREAGGLRESLAVAFNDIDLCMKIRALGYRVIYDPRAAWHHYESRSRGLEDTPEKVRRFNGEIAVFASHWKGILEAGDPYYHRALTLRKANFALKDLTKEKIGEPYRLELDVDAQVAAVKREKLRRGISG